MTVEYAPHGLIGVLTPQANTTVEPEFWLMLPPGVAMINARMTSDKPSLEARLVDYFDQIDKVVEQFVSGMVPVSRGTAGADALSILTDKKYFGGTLADLEEATALFRSEPPAVPCLRKDFMVHPVQVLQAREAGASAILIIVRALEEAEIAALFAAAQAAGLDALFEVHNEAEAKRAVAHGAKILGVNNRDLAVFKTDLALSERLIPQFPRDVIAVSESGIVTGADAARARQAGAHAVLVGEALMKAKDPAALIADFHAA